MRNFGLSQSSQVKCGDALHPLAGPTLEARSFIRDDRDFIAGLFSGVVLTAPFFIVGAIYLFF